MATSEMLAAGVQDHPSRGNVHTGLRTPGLLAERPIIGLIMFIFGSLLFGGLAYNLVAHGPLLGWDVMLARILPAMALSSPAFVKSIMDAGFYIGNQGIMAFGVLLGLYFVYKRSWQELAMLAIGLVGASGLFLSLTAVFARPRPPTQMWIIVNLPGFPSGHAISSVAFYGLLAYLLVARIASAFWKAFVVAAALLLILFIGFSRIFTGGHYLTDVLAGYAVGIAWSGAIYTLIETVFQRIRSRHVGTA
jgi:membrane-associated phospholipid phosphatase